MNELFERVEKSLANLDGSTAEMQDWSLNYFRNHRKRYMSDIGVVMKYHETGRILELGSAPFHFTALLREMGLPVTGVDINPERFSGYIRSEGLDVVKCDVENEELPFGDGSFQLVVFNEVFEHMRINPITTLQKIHRVIQPGGYLMLSTPNLYSIVTYINFVMGKGFDDPYEQFDKLQKFGHMGHVREYAVPQVRKFLRKTGFEEVEVKMQSHTPLKGLWTPFNFIRLLFPRFHAFQTHIWRKK